jgi:hypothetical protein
MEILPFVFSRELSRNAEVCMPSPNPINLVWLLMLTNCVQRFHLSFARVHGEPATVGIYKRYIEHFRFLYTNFRGEGFPLCNASWIIHGQNIWNNLWLLVEFRALVAYCDYPPVLSTAVFPNHIDVPIT